VEINQGNDFGRGKKQEEKTLDLEKSTSARSGRGEEETVHFENKGRNKCSDIAQGGAQKSF